ncbi:MAG: hypothetical protein GX259_05710 [Bacteroidales bacterium]|nr:hypothetical protein [Bacteroidales bacterium]
MKKTSNLPEKLQTKRSKKELRVALFEWQTVAVIQILQKDLQQHRSNCCNGSNNTQNCDSNLSASCTHKSTLINLNPSFISYIYAMFILFKKAFRHKKSNNLIVIK